MGFRNPAVWMILILLIILLFGASKLPDITRNIGKSLKIFKEEVRDLSDDRSSSTIDHQPPSAPQSPPAQSPPASQPPTAPQTPEDPPQAPQPPADR